MPSSRMTHDLEGLLVVSVEQAVAAPYASGRLADAGARVIKVERPEGDFARRYDAYVNGESAYFVWLNRGKESAGLDLKEAADRVHPEPRARRHRPPRLRAGRLAREKPASDHLLDLRLRRRGTLPRP